MVRSLAKISRVGIPADLVEFFDNPPLVGDESPEGYWRTFKAIAVDLEAADAINWLYVKDVVDATWQIRRERRVLASTIELFQTEVIRDLLKRTADSTSVAQPSIYRIFKAADDAQRWANDPKARSEIDMLLASRGYSQSAVLAEANIRGMSVIEIIDKRVSSCEARRVAAVREIERRNKKLARDVDAASSQVIDAEFSEAAE